MTTPDTSATQAPHLKNIALVFLGIALGIAIALAAQKIRPGASPEAEKIRSELIFSLIELKAGTESGLPLEVLRKHYRDISVSSDKAAMLSGLSRKEETLLSTLKGELSKTLEVWKLDGEADCAGYYKYSSEKCAKAIAEKLYLSGYIINQTIGAKDGRTILHDDNATLDEYTMSLTNILKDKKPSTFLKDAVSFRLTATNIAIEAALQGMKP